MKKEKFEIYLRKKYDLVSVLSKDLEEEFLVGIIRDDYLKNELVRSYVHKTDKITAFFFPDGYDEFICPIKKESKYYLRPKDRIFFFKDEITPGMHPCISYYSKPEQ